MSIADLKNIIVERLEKKYGTPLNSEIFIPLMNISDYNSGQEMLQQMQLQNILGDLKSNIRCNHVNYPNFMLTLITVPHYLDI